MLTFFEAFNSLHSYRYVFSTDHVGLLIRKVNYYLLRIKSNYLFEDFEFFKQSAAIIVILINSNSSHF